MALRSRVVAWHRAPTAGLASVVACLGGVAVLGVALGLGCGLGAPGAAGAATRDLSGARSSETARAHNALLVLGDMPSGWSSTKGDGDDGGFGLGGRRFATEHSALARCIGAPRALLGQNPPDVSSPEFDNKAQTLTIDDDVSLFASDTQARQQFAVLANPKTPGCLNALLEGPAGPRLLGAPPKGMTYGPMDTAGLDPSTFGRSVAGFVLTLPFIDHGDTVAVRATFVSFIKGTLGQTITFTSIGLPFSGALMRHLTSVAEARL